MKRDPVKAELWLRMVFSALVDADFLDTERHFNLGRAALRSSDPDMDQLWDRFQTRHRESVRGASRPVNAVRSKVYDACLAAAERPPGVFRLRGTVGTAATMAVKAIGHDLSSRLLSPREQLRGGGVYTLAAGEIVERCGNGERVRDDGFFGTGGGERSDAEEVWESTLQKSQREAEEKKLPYMAHLLANLAFNTEISAAMAHQMTKVAESMTYRQLCILHLSATKERFDLRKRSYEGEKSFPKDLYQIIYEYYDLYNRGLVNLGEYLASSPAEINPGTATPQALETRTETPILSKLPFS